MGYKRKRGVSTRKFYGTKRGRSTGSALSNVLASNIVRSVFKKGMDRYKTARKNKFKGNGSPTMTMQKKRYSDDVRTDATGLHKKDLGLVVLTKKVNHEKLLGNYQYRNINQWIVQGLQGHQVADFPEVMFTRAQLIGDVSDVRSDRIRWPDSPKLLNPFAGHPGSTIYPVPATGVVNDVIYIKNCKTIHHLLNMTKIPMNVDIYWVMPKYDTDMTPVSSWTDILNSKFMGQTGQTGATNTASTTATPGGALRIDYGQNPYQHQEFTKLWKCVKTSHCIIQAGEQVDLFIDFKMEKIVNIMNLATRNCQYLRGLTIFPLIIARCGLEGIATGETGASLEVAYGQVKLGVVANHNITFGALPQSRFSTARTYTGTIVSTTQVEKTIDDDDVIIPVKPDL